MNIYNDVIKKTLNVVKRGQEGSIFFRMCVYLSIHFREYSPKCSFGLSRISISIIGFCFIHTSASGDWFSSPGLVINYHARKNSEATCKTNFWFQCSAFPHELIIADWCWLRRTSAHNIASLLLTFCGRFEKSKIQRLRAILNFHDARGESFDTISLFFSVCVCL